MIWSPRSFFPSSFSQFAGVMTPSIRCQPKGHGQKKSSPWISLCWWSARVLAYSFDRSGGGNRKHAYRWSWLTYWYKTYPCAGGGRAWCNRWEQVPKFRLRAWARIWSSCAADKHRTYSQTAQSGYRRWLRRIGIFQFCNGKMPVPETTPRVAFACSSSGWSSPSAGPPAI